MATRYFTAVFAYEGDALRDDPIYDRMYALMQVDSGPLRICGASHANEMTRSERLEEIIGRAADADELLLDVDALNGDIYGEPPRPQPQKLDE